MIYGFAKQSQGHVKIYGEVGHGTAARLYLPRETAAVEATTPGRQLTDAARARRPGLRAAFTSGYTENSIVHQGKLDKSVSLPSEPFRRWELALKIWETLDG